MNKFLLTGGKFILFTNHRERIQKFTETDNLKHLHRNESGKADFAHDAAYSDSKDLTRRTILDNIFQDKAHWYARNRNYDGYQRTLACMFYKCFDQKTVKLVTRVLLFHQRSYACKKGFVRLQ